MQKSTLREYTESILIAAILALFIRTFVFQAFKIPTGSMEDNLLVGDHILVNKFIYGPTATPFEDWLLPVRALERQDVIVFRAPQEPDKYCPKLKARRFNNCISEPRRYMSS